MAWFVRSFSLYLAPFTAPRRLKEIREKPRVTRGTASYSGRDAGAHYGRTMIFANGIPLTGDRQIVGAVGVSGGDGEQDQTVAEAAAAAL